MSSREPAKPDETLQNGISDTPRNGSEVISLQPSLITSEAVLLEVVAEKTGYPAEMLELDMELDADLGIDSIKRVEIFSALQERLPHAPVVKSEHLGTLRTLRQVVDFLSGTVGAEVINDQESKPLVTRAIENQRVANGNGSSETTNGFHSLKPAPP